MNLSRGPVRYRVLGLLGLLSFITYLDRVCFGSAAPFVKAEFGLSETQRGLLFSAFALAYAAFEVPTGWLGDRFGPKKTLLRIVLWWSAFTALTGLIWPTPSWPLLGFSALVAVRFLFGMGEAGAYPNISRALQNWFPYRQRGAAQGFIWMMGRFGGGLTPLVAAGLFALFAETQEVVRWRPVFWILGLVGVVWCGAFVRNFCDRPEQHPAVGDEELRLLQAERGGAAAGHREVPWRRLLADGNLWALCLMYFCTSYGWYFNITYLPGYLKERFRMPDQTLRFTLLAGAPLLVGALACLVGGFATDGLVRLTGDRKWGRRWAGVLGHGVCAGFYFLALFAGTAEAFVAAIALAAFFNDLTMGSSWSVCQDIGGPHTGVVSGCMNTIGNLGGAAAGLLTGLILDLTKPAEPNAWNDLGWTINLISFGVVYVVAVLLWLRIDATKAICLEADELSAL